MILKEDVIKALVECDYYIQTTAKKLNIGRDKLKSLIKIYGISVEKRIKGGKPKWKVKSTKATSIWYKMVDRCHNPENKDYIHYGGRGIQVCKSWRESRDTFAEYIVGLEHHDSDEYTLDRINNNGNYEPGNIKFSTRKEQSRNTRRNSILVLDGITYTAVEFSDKFGISQDFIKDRLKLGFTPEEILLIPKGVKRKTFYQT